ncbi:MAG: hypothetical protein QE487_15410 [Fluviicola sp.]|nr:hypothetical protein [Fluviicola sp.]
MAIIQPIGFITREAALRELQPYLILNRRSGQPPSPWWPIVHHRFDGRTNRLVANHGAQVNEGFAALERLITRIQEIQQVAIRHLRLLEPTPARGTSSRGTNRGTQQDSPPISSAPIDPVSVRRFTLIGSRRMISELLPELNRLSTTTLIINAGPQLHVIQNRRASTINPNSTSREQMQALTALGQRMDAARQHLTEFLANPMWVLQANQPDPNQTSVADRSLIASLRTQINRTGESLTSLRNRYANLNRIHLTAEYLAAHNNDPDPTISLPENSINTPIDNEFAVRLNWDHPHLMPVKHHPGARNNQHSIDLFMAIAVKRFLIYIKGLRVTEVYTEGFQRDPLGLNDPHPSGRAWDLTGFRVNLGPTANSSTAGIVLHLRSGHPLHAVRGASSRSADLNNYRTGPSDWFNFAPMNNQNTNVYFDEIPMHSQRPPINYTSKEGYLRMLVGEMPRFFARIHGPGSDAQHMDHFHLDYQTTASVAQRFGIIECPATIDDPIPYIRPPQAPRRRGSLSANRH